MHWAIHLKGRHTNSLQEFPPLLFLLLAFQQMQAAMKQGGLEYAKSPPSFLTLPTLQNYENLAVLFTCSDLVFHMKTYFTRCNTSSPTIVLDKTKKITNLKPT